MVLPNTQKEIANMFGDARPSIGRAFRQMDNEGYSEARGKYVTIVNKTGLSNLLR